MAKPGLDLEDGDAILVMPGNWFRQRGIDIKTAQELLRHANSRITMEIYQQAVSAEKREAQNRVVAGLIPAGVLQHPSAPSEGV